MESLPVKRRRVSLTRSFDISPIKAVPNGHHTNGITRTVGKTTGSLKASSNPALKPFRRSQDILVKKPSSQRSLLVMDGANDEDVFNLEKIGRESRRKKSSTPRSLNSTPLRNTTPNRGPQPSASPVRSVRASSPQQVANGKSRRQAGNDSSYANEDQENLQVERRREEGAERQASLNGAQDASTTTTTVNHLDETGEETENIEPELPMLPAQLGLEQMPTPPQGLLSSSPSGRKQRRLARQRSTLSGVSSLNSGARPSKATTAQQPESTGRGSEVADEDEVEDGGNGDDDDPTRQEDGIPQEPSGPIITWDLAIERKQNEYEMMLREKNRLEAETRLLESGLPNLTRDAREEYGGQANDSQLLQVLLSDSNPNQPSNSTVPSTNDKLVSFLPFSVPIAPTSRPLSTSTPEHSGSKIDPKPHLQFFTPFSICLESSEIITDSLSNEDGAFQQKQLLKLNSSDDLIELELELITCPLRQDIVSFRTLSVSSWAEDEFRSRFCKRFEHPGGTQAGNVVTLGAGLSHYWDLACLRASIWSQLVSEHAALVVDVPELPETKEKSKTKRASKSKAKSKRKEKGKKGKARGGTDSENDDGDDNGVDDNDDSFVEDDQVQLQRRARAHRSLHLGRRKLQLRRDNVALLFSWDIELDRAGEARSELDACVACPQSWRDGDEDRSLERIGELFHLLVRRQGVKEAVGSIVNMVFGESETENSG